MKTLGSISFIADGIKAASVKVIKNLHKIIFENEGDRKNRQRIREFDGFKFEKDSDEYKTKVKYITQNFTLSELHSVVNLLHLESDEVSIEKLSKFVCDSLINIEELTSNLSDNEEENGEDENNNNNNDAISKSNSEVDNLSIKSDVAESEPVDNLGRQLSTVSFRDVEDSIPTFDGVGMYPAFRWTQDVEDLAKMLEWSDLKKFIFAKNHLVGLAKIFIQSERNIKNWESLKNALLNEFGSVVNSMKLHQMLAERKINNTESPYEYFLIMKEIASRGSIENEVLMQYIIDGLRGNEQSKIVLYVTLPSERNSIASRQK